MEATSTRTPVVPYSIQKTLHFKPGEHIPYAPKRLLYEIARSNIKNFTGTLDFFKFKTPTPTPTGLTPASDIFVDSYVVGYFTLPCHATDSSLRLHTLSKLLMDYNPESSDERFSFNGTFDENRTGIRLIDTHTLSESEMDLISPSDVWLPDTNPANPTLLSSLPPKLVFVRVKVASPHNSLGFTTGFVKSGLLEASNFFLDDIDLTCDYQGVVDLEAFSDYLQTEILNPFAKTKQRPFSDPTWDGGPTLLDTSASTGGSACLQWMCHIPALNNTLARVKFYHPLVKAIESGPLRSRTGQRISEWVNARQNRTAKSRDNTTTTGLTRVEVTLYTNRKLNQTDQADQAVHSSNRAETAKEVLSPSTSEFTRILTTIASLPPTEFTHHCPHSETVRAWVENLNHTLCVYDTESNSGLVCWSLNEVSNRLCSYHVPKNWSESCEQIFKFMGVGVTPMDVICVSRHTGRDYTPVPNPPPSSPCSPLSDSDDDESPSSKRVYNAEYDIDPNSDPFASVFLPSPPSPPSPPTPTPSDDESENDDDDRAIELADAKSILDRPAYIKRGHMQICYARLFRFTSSPDEPLVTRFPGSKGLNAASNAAAPHSNAAASANWEISRRLLISSGLAYEENPSQTPPTPPTPPTNPSWANAAPISGMTVQLPTKRANRVDPEVRVEAGYSWFGELDVTSIKYAVTFDLLKAYKAHRRNCESPESQSAYVQTNREAFRQSRLQHAKTHTQFSKANWIEERAHLENRLTDQINKLAFRDWLCTQSGAATSLFTLEPATYVIIAIVELGLYKATLLLRKEGDLQEGCKPPFFTCVCTLAISEKLTMHRLVTDAATRDHITHEPKKTTICMFQCDHASLHSDIGVFIKRGPAAPRKGKQDIDATIYINGRLVYTPSPPPTPPRTTISTNTTNNAPTPESEPASLPPLLPLPDWTGNHFKTSTAPLTNTAFTPSPTYAAGLCLELTSFEFAHRRTSTSDIGKPGIVFDCIARSLSNPIPDPKPQRLWASPHLFAYLSNHAVTTLGGAKCLPQSKRFLLLDIRKCDSKVHPATHASDWLAPKGHKFAELTTPLKPNANPSPPRSINLLGVKTTKTNDGRDAWIGLCTKGRFWRMGNSKHLLPDSPTGFCNLAAGWRIDTVQFIAVPGHQEEKGEKEEQEEEEPPTKRPRLESGLAKELGLDSDSD